MNDTYIRSKFMNRWRDDIENAYGMLSYLHNIFSSHQIDYFLVSGSLLGYARHKKFIPWDDDIDIIIFQKDIPKLLELSNQFATDKYTVIKQHDTLYKFFSPNGLKIRSLRWTFPFIDIFIATTESKPNPISIPISMPISTSTPTPTPTPTSMSIPTFTPIPTFTAIRTLTHILTPTPTPTPTSTPTPTPTSISTLTPSVRFFKTEYDHDAIYPLKLDKINNMDVYVPNKPDVVLNKIFGPNFMTVCVSPSWCHRDEQGIKGRITASYNDIVRLGLS